MIEELVKRYPVLESVKGQIEDAYKILETCYEDGGKLLIAGNGGSAADSDHIVGELMKGFVKRRPVSAELAEALKQADPERGEELAKKLQGGLPAIALTNHTALSSAFANDVDGMLSYAQQVNGYGKAGDVFLGISTSGNSENVMYAAVTAKAKGLKLSVSQERQAESSRSSQMSLLSCRSRRPTRSRNSTCRSTMRSA